MRNVLPRTPVGVSFSHRTVSSVVVTQSPPPLEGDIIGCVAIDVTRTASKTACNITRAREVSGGSNGAQCVYLSIRGGERKGR